MEKFRKNLVLFFVSNLVVIMSFLLVLSCFIVYKGAFVKPYYQNNSNALEGVIETKYAKTKENCVLYRTRDTDNNSVNNIWFIVPESYFVSFSSSEQNVDDVLHVFYRDVEGYVKTSSVSIVNFVPKTPYLLGVHFDIAFDSSTHLRWFPKIGDNSSIRKLIPASTKNIEYVASVLTSDSNYNLWYYAYYTPDSEPTSVYSGYVYSGNVINLSAFSLNSEGAEIEDSLSPAESDDKEVDFAINPTIKIVLIVLICVPIVLVFILLLISNRKNKNGKIDEIEKEFEESSKEEKQSKKKSKKKIASLDQLEGETLERKPVFYTKFLEKRPTTANLEPEFPTYEVIDDEDLL